MSALPFQIAFVAGLAVVALSLAAVAFGRGSERLLAWLAVVLAVGSGAAFGALAFNLAAPYADSDAILLAAGGLAAAAVAEAGLLALARAFRRVRALDDVAKAARARLDAFLDAHSKERAAELERTLAREEANAIHLLSTQERRLAEERRDTVAKQADKARAELATAVASEQERLERRLAAWAADLDRGQRELEGRLAALAEHQREALTRYEARLSSDGDRIAAAAEEQRALLGQVRANFARTAMQLLDEGKAEIEAHVVERRRALQEMNDRLREREAALREQIEREAAEARAALAAAFEEAQRRQLDQLERTVERAAARFAEDAERRFEAHIRDSREKAAERLARELDKMVEQFTRRAEKQVSDRVAEVARETAQRLETRLDAIARAGEAQQQALAGERLKVISERLDEALANAEERIASFETHIEIEIAGKLAEVRRALRSTQREPI